MQKITIIGVGGTGGYVTQLLSRKDYELTIIDRDVVEESNLDRQILFTKADIGKPKVIAAKEKIEEFCKVKTKFDDLNSDTIDFDCDLVIDCTDNTETRLLINDYCKKNKIPWIYSAAIEKIGSVYFNSSNRPCFQCFNGTKYGQTCNEVGVLNSTLAMVGAIVANIAINFLEKEQFEKDLIRINMKNNEITKIKVKQNPECECCKGNYNYLEGNATKKILKCCSSQHYQFSVNLDLNNIRKRLKNYKDMGTFIKYNEIFITKNRVLIKADSESEAKKKYDEVIGI